MAADAPEAACAEVPYAEVPSAEVSSAEVPAPADLTPEESLAGRQIALIDLLDRLLNGGAVLTGDVVLSIADVDLVHINLRAVIRSLTPDDPAPW
ncbi:gas vesicle protein [Streptomyces platensis]